MYKKSTLALALLGVFALSTGAYAADNGNTIKLKEDSPESYVVKTGDTLWSLSGQYLQNPLQWPQLWKMNKEQIKNPNRIYPGDVVYLDKSGDQPELRLVRDNTITLNPGIRIEPLDREPIPTISPAVIGPFLSQPLVIDTADFEKAPEIIGVNTDQVVLTAGTRAYAAGVVDTTKKQWRVYRSGKDMIDPVTKKSLGMEAIYLGDAELVSGGDPATFNLTKTNQEILVRDRLIADNGADLGKFIPHSPENPVNGQILSSYAGVSELGVGMIMTINRGSEDGLEAGHVLDSYKAGAVIKDPRPSKSKSAAANPKLAELNFDVSKDKDGKAVVNIEKAKADINNKLVEAGYIKLPDERTGAVMVFRTFKHVSYGLVMQASVPVHVGDVLKSR